MAALVAAAVAPYLATLLFGFVYDDVGIILRNEAIRGWPSLVTLWGKPYWVTSEGLDAAGLYRPLPMVLFATLWNAGLRWAIWFHVLIVASHAIATVLVWHLLRRAVSLGAATLAAIWFAVHPLHIEAVANIVNGTEVLVSIAVLSFVLLVSNSEQQLSWRASIAAGACFAAALLTKESGITTPLLALVVVWGWGRASSAEQSSVTHFRRLAIVCGCVLVAVIAARVVVLGGLVTGKDIAAPGLAGVSGPARVWAMLALGPSVLGLLVWPRVLNPHYGPRVLEGHFGPNWLALMFLVLLAAMGVLAWRLTRRGDRRFAAALAWMAIAFLPASNLLVATGQILAERTLYLSSVGIAMLAAVVLDQLATMTGRVGVRVATVAAVVLLALAARVTQVRAREWRTQETVYRQMITADPENYRGYWLLAWYTRANRPAEALAMYERAHSLYARDSEFLFDYMRLLLEQNRPARAVAIGDELLRSTRRPEVVIPLYLGAVRSAYGPDSLRAAQARLSLAGQGSGR